MVRNIYFFCKLRNEFYFGEKYSGGVSGSPLRLVRVTNLVKKSRYTERATHFAFDYIKAISNSCAHLKQQFSGWQPDYTNGFVLQRIVLRIVDDVYIIARLWPI